jgi:hypothetical protein
VALNTALDKTGATLGPLLIAPILSIKGGQSYRIGYAELLVAARVVQWLRGRSPFLA